MHWYDTREEAFTRKTKTERGVATVVFVRDSCSCVAEETTCMEIVPWILKTPAHQIALNDYSCASPCAQMVSSHFIRGTHRSALPSRLDTPFSWI